MKLTTPVRGLLLSAAIAALGLTLHAAAPAPAAPPSAAAPATPAANPAAPAAAGRGRGGRGGAAAGPAIVVNPLPDVIEAMPTPDKNGNYKIGPTYTPAPELTAKDGTPKGVISRFTMNAADSKFYPNTGLRGATPTRAVSVYVPTQLKEGAEAPFIILQDANQARTLPVILDNMINDKRLPAMVAIFIANGGGDGGGSERGLEYDTVSGKYAEFVEAEVLPQVEKTAHVKLTKDPDGRCTYGSSSGAAAAFSMAWFHPELYHRVISYSGTFVNQHPDADYPHGAWEYHDGVIAKADKKPIRVWMEVGSRDNGSTAPEAGYHNWTLANNRMAEVLKSKGYDYQYIFAMDAGHVDGKVVAQTTPEALEWVWKGYKAK